MDYERTIQLLAAALAPITACLALLVAYQQYRVQRDQTRLLLYERRLRVYRAYRRLLSAMVFDAKLDSEHAIQTMADLDEAPHLFSSDDAAQIAEAARRMRELLRVAGILRGDAAPPGAFDLQSRAAYVKQDGDLRNWAWQQLESVDKRFRKYLAAEIV